MSDPANSRPETADERASALLADATRAAHGPYPCAGASLASLMEPHQYRLNEIERITIRQLFENLVESIEGELRARLLARADLPDASEFRASLGAAHVSIAWPTLLRTGFPEDQELADILVRRGKSYGVMRSLRQNAVMTESGQLKSLTEHGDPDIASDAMKLLIAESRINDRFDDPRLDRADLPKTVEYRLVWTIAAALRDYGEHMHRLDGWLLDTPISGTATAMLMEQAESLPVDVIAMGLAANLDQAGLLDGRLLVEALSGARFTLYVAMLAVRAGTTFDVAWEMAAMPDAPSHMVLLKSIGVEREAASHLLISMARAALLDVREADEIAAAWIEAYDVSSDDAIAAAMRPWRLDSAYRSAITRFAARVVGMPR
jgi:hypothetical protein